MSIFPLPVFEADADPNNREALSDSDIYERLEAPKTIVIRFGAMKNIGEYKYDGDAKPGCGTKLVARTHRGTELGEMLTTTCDNAGCSKSVTRKEMLSYIEQSGGKTFPFFTNGRILRVARIEDLNRQSALNTEKPAMVKTCRGFVEEFGLDMKLVDAEPILGGELLTFYYMSEQRIDFRELVKKLAAEFGTRIEMRQVGARDEARLVADYERCGQYCCCKNFLKVLKPVSMRSAKVQKKTLDTLKISGRCGRLMCCLRYEDQTYKELKANLPHRKTRVGTEEGPGIVVDSKILVQLVLVRLEHDNREIAVPVEELMDPDNCPPPGSKPKMKEPDPLRGMPEETVRDRIGDGEEDDERPSKKKGRRRRRRKPKDQQQDEFRERSRQEEGERDDAGSGSGGGKKRRRRRRKSGAAATGEGGKGPEASGDGPAGAEGGGKKKRRRRRRGRGRGRSGGGEGGEGPSES